MDVCDGGAMSESGGTNEASEKKVPTILGWEDGELPMMSAASQWDRVVAEVRETPGGKWARVQRPTAFSSGTPSWFRKKFPDLEIFVPPARGRGGRTSDVVFVRKKPLATHPES